MDLSHHALEHKSFQRVRKGTSKRDSLKLIRVELEDRLSRLTGPKGTEAVKEPELELRWKYGSMRIGCSRLRLLLMHLLLRHVVLVVTVVALLWWLHILRLLARRRLVLVIHRGKCLSSRKAGKKERE